MLKIARIPVISSAANPDAPRLQITLHAIKIDGLYSVHLILELLDKVWLVRGVTQDAIDAPTWRDFTAFVAHSNRVGFEDGLHFWGGSTIFDPNGGRRVIVQVPERDYVIWKAGALAVTIVLFFLAELVHWSALSAFYMLYAIHLQDLGVGEYIGMGHGLGAMAEVALMWSF